MIQNKDLKDFILEDNPVLIYVHSQQGCKLEGLFLKEEIITNNISLVLFDFCGCGKSEGQYISLGHKESIDLLYLIQYLKNKLKVGNIALYGRSMGAVTCLLFAQMYPYYITYMVLDSPFQSMKSMLNDFTKNKF